MPGLLCAVCVLESEGEDGAALFHGVFAFSVIGEGGVYGVEGGGGGKVGFRSCVSMSASKDEII